MKKIVYSVSLLISCSTWLYPNPEKSYCEHNKTWSLQYHTQTTSTPMKNNRNEQKIDKLGCFAACLLCPCSTIACCLTAICGKLCQPKRSHAQQLLAETEDYASENV